MSNPKPTSTKTLADWMERGLEVFGDRRLVNLDDSTDEVELLDEFPNFAHVGPNRRYFLSPVGLILLGKYLQRKITLRMAVTKVVAKIRAVNSEDAEELWWNALARHLGVSSGLVFFLGEVLGKAHVPASVIVNYLRTGQISFPDDAYLTYELLEEYGYMGQGKWPGFPLRSDELHWAALEVAQDALREGNRGPMLELLKRDEKDRILPGRLREKARSLRTRLVHASQWLLLQPTRSWREDHVQNPMVFETPTTTPRT